LIDEIYILQGRIVGFFAGKGFISIVQSESRQGGGGSNSPGRNFSGGGTFGEKKE